MVYRTRILAKEKGEIFILRPQYKEAIIFLSVIFVAGCFNVYYILNMFYVILWILIYSIGTYYYYITKKIIVLKNDSFLVTHDFKKILYSEKENPYSQMKRVYYHSSSAMGGDILTVIFFDKGKINKGRYVIEGKVPFEIFSFLISKNVLLFIDNYRLAEIVFKMKVKDMHTEGKGLNIYATGQINLVGKG